MLIRDITELLANNEVDKITDDDIVVMVLNEETVENELIDESINHIPHSNVFKAIEAALEYITQQEE